MHLLDIEGFKKSYIKSSAVYFYKLAEKYEEKFSHLHPQLVSADIRMLLKTWLSILFFTTLLAFIVSFGTTLLLGLILGFDIIVLIVMVLFVPVLAASFTFIFFYLYPLYKKNRIKKNIETNLPFALTHMSALASSGLSPEHIFDMMVGFREYGEISSQARLIVRNMKAFGMSSSEAIKGIAARTPSQNFRHVLIGIQTTTEKGGDLVHYLNELAEKAVLEYRMRRETYLKTLEMYADLYTTVLVAAPLMLLVVLAIMGMIGGDVFGFSVDQLMFLITWVILPVLNVFFIAFIELTYPGI